MDAHAVGRRIAAFRKSLGLTQQELAERLSVTNKAVSKWETGGGLPDIAILPSIAAALGVSVDEIIADGPDKSSGPGVRRYQRKPAFWLMIVAIAVLIPVGVMLFTGLLSPATEAAPASGNVITDSGTIIFPFSDRGKTEYNARVYSVEPFCLYVQLPENWSYKERDPKFIYLVLDMNVFSILDIYDDNGELVGAFGYITYEEYEGAEDLPQAIYNQIALGNHYFFDVRESYTVIKETDTGVTAICDVVYSPSANSGRDETRNKGIVSYNRDLLVYVAMEFFSDWVTDEQVKAIAESILISKGK